MYDGLIFCILFTAAGLSAGGDLRKLRGNDVYTEELLIKRLKSEHLLKQFRFVITTDAKLGSVIDIRIASPGFPEFSVRSFRCY